MRCFNTFSIFNTEKWILFFVSPWHSISGQHFLIVMYLRVEGAKSADQIHNSQSSGTNFKDRMPHTQTVPTLVHVYFVAVTTLLIMKLIYIIYIYIYIYIYIFIAALIFLLEYFRITRAFCILPYCTVYIVRSRARSE